MEFIKNMGWPDKWGKNTAVILLAALIFEILIAGFTVISPLSALVFLAAGAVLLILFVKPEYSLYLLFFMIIPGRSTTFTMYEVTQYSYHLLVGIVLFYYCAARLTKSIPPFVSIGFTQPFLLLWVWALLSLLWSPDLVVGIEDILRLSASIALIFLITAFVYEPKTLSIALWFFIFMSIVDAIIAFSYPYSSFYVIKKLAFFESLDVKFLFWPKHIGSPEGGRMMGFSVAHATAVTLSFAITFCMMFFFVTENIKKRILLMGIALFLFVVTIGTLTKSMTICLIFGIGYVVLHLKPFRKYFLTIMFVVFVLMIAAFFLARSKNVGRSAQALSENLKVHSNEKSATSVSGRLEVSKKGLQKLLETGGLGTGIGGFLYYTGAAHMDGSHPSVLWDLGFVGIAAWIWLLTGSYRLFVGAIKNSNNEYYKRMLIVYLGGYINVLIAWFFTFDYADIYLWFYLGIGFALVRLSQTGSIDENKRLPFSKDEESIVII